MSARRVKGEGSIYQRTEHEAPPHRVNGRGLADQERIDMNKDTEIVADVIRKGYQDATTSVLDRMVSEDIVEALRAAGWATPEEVRAIVAAAGGRVEVPDCIWVDPPQTLARVDYRERFLTILTTAEVAR